MWMSFIIMETHSKKTKLRWAVPKSPSSTKSPQTYRGNSAHQDPTMQEEEAQ